jgi:hypothetical protein
MKNLLLFVALAAASSLASAQVYKCVDAQGKTVYSQAPCPGTAKSTTIDSRPAPAAAPAAKGSDPRKADAEFKKRQLEAQKEQEKEQKASEEKEAKKVNCASAQQQLQLYQSGQRLSRLNASGERYYLDEKDIAQETAKAQQAVQQWCGS